MFTSGPGYFGQSTSQRTAIFLELLVLSRVPCGMSFRSCSGKAIFGNYIASLSQAVPDFFWVKLMQPTRSRKETAALKGNSFENWPFRPDSQSIGVVSPATR